MSLLSGLERAIAEPRVTVNDPAPGSLVEPAKPIPVGSPSLRVVASRVEEPTVVRPASLTSYGVTNKIPPGVANVQTERARPEHYLPAVLYSPGRVVDLTPPFSRGRVAAPHVVEVSPATGSSGTIAADRRRRMLWIALGALTLLYVAR